MDRPQINALNSKKKLELARKIAHRLDPDRAKELGKTTLDILDTLCEMEAEIRAYVYNRCIEEPTADAYPLYWMNAVAEQKMLRKVLGNKRPLRVISMGLK